MNNVVLHAQKVLKYSNKALYGGTAAIRTFFGESAYPFIPFIVIVFDLRIGFDSGKYA